VYHLFPENKILTIAHRGARSLAPENTLAAARKGLEAGADLWELDVTLTADGQPIIIHDDTLEGTSNASLVYPDRSPWRVCDFTLAEVRRLDFGSWFEREDPFGQIAEGKVSREDLDSYRNEPVPTLEEALRYTRQHNWCVNVEIKDHTGTPGDSQVVERVVDQIRGLGMVERVVISSFNHAYLAQAMHFDSAIETAALVGEPDPDPLGLLRRLGAQGYHPAIYNLDWDQLAALKAAGYAVSVWTVNNSLDMEALIQAGVTGIITDYPQMLHNMLHNRQPNILDKAVSIE